MPLLTIDDHPIEVPPGTKVIAAAEQLGIMIPRFCYHAALGSVGACRLCAVMCLDGPVKGLQMSCMVDAQDGMVVSTTDAKAVDFRRQVIEWLMLHHPHDCPVCDEGGHCLLQDHTASSGHAIRRYRGAKRTHRDQYLGPLLQHEMNRCIQCYRCSRYYQDFAGARDLSVMQIGNKVYFGRDRDGTLQSPFAGNLADICPTGVFTDKPSRYMGRRWDYERSPAVCIHCSLGCNIVVSARYREVVRLEARFNPHINGYFMCDRGRHGFTYASAAGRPRQALFEGQPADVDATLQHTVERLTSIARVHGLAAVACIGSLRSSVETQGALVRLCNAQGWPAPAFFDDDERMAAVQTAVAQQHAQVHVSLRAVENADAVIVAGCDPIAEAPMLALALRQAQRRGATIVVIDPRPIELPLAFQHPPLAADQLAACFDDLITRVGAVAHDPGKLETGPPADPLAAAADLLARSRRPVVVCGTDLPNVAAIRQAGKLARLLRENRESGLFHVLPGANAYSAALLNHGRSMAQVAADIAQGTVKALLVVETDPFHHLPNRKRLTDALARLELLVALDYLDGPHTRKAHVFLPSTTIFESGGTFINQEGRVQKTAGALQGGTALRLVSNTHPPRLYGQGIPGNQPTPAWLMLSALSGEAAFGSSADILQWLAREVPGFENLKAADPPTGEDPLLDPAGRSEMGRHSLDFASESPLTPPDSGGGLHLLSTERTFGSEELSCRSPQLIELESTPQARLATSEARRLALNDGDRIALAAENGFYETTLKVADNMAEGTLVVGRHCHPDWPWDGRHVRLPVQSIQRIEERETKIYP